MTRAVVTAAVVAALVAVVLLVKRSIDRKTYTSYEVVASEERSDSLSRYEYVNGYIVRYSADGASLLNSDLENVWSAAWSMSDPQIDTAGSTILFYDRGGTDIFLYNEKERLGAFSTDAEIRTARVSEAGTAAVLMDDGQNVKFSYYNADGTEIAGGSSTMDNPGYAFAAAVSPDGLHVGISYLTASGGRTGSVIRFYGFDSEGKSKENNMVGELTLDGVFAPELEFLAGGDCAVIRDDGFTIVRDLSDPADAVEVHFDDEIVSAFHDDTHLGFMFRSQDRGHLYSMRIYSSTGREESATDVDYSFTNIRVCGNEVIMNSSADFTIYSTGGWCRYNGTLNEGSISDVLKIGGRRYLVLTDQVMETVRLT